MTGNQDRADPVADWAAGLQETLMPIIDRGVAVVQAAEPKDGDVAEVTRQARAVGAIARTATAIVAMTPAPRTARVPEPTEDDMNTDDRDDSPETLDRLRAELESRLNRLHALIEEKRVDCLAGGGRVAWGDEESLRAA